VAVLDFGKQGAVTGRVSAVKERNCKVFILSHPKCIPQFISVRVVGVKSILKVRDGW
jgi:hypothetical protein